MHHVDLLGWITADLAAMRQRLDDGVLGLVPVERWAEQADGGGSSINHLVLHLARHQDLAVNTAIRNRAPLFAAHAAALGMHDPAPAAGLAEREDRHVTGGLTPDALRRYVAAVFDGTARWLRGPAAQDPDGLLDTIPPTSRRLAAKGAISVDEAGWLHRMWDGRSIGWLVQWPVVGHGHTHVGEATSVRNRLGFSPF